MEMYQQFFNRYEKKYLIDEMQYRRLISRIYTKLEYDDYEKYKICNIYFDTLQYDLIRASVEKPLYKEKFRLRSYGTPAITDTVFLEIKKKYDGIVYKRRLALPYREAIDFCTGIKIPEEKSQVLSEIQWLMERYELYPMLYLSYDRLAMRGAEDPKLRITFDTNIIWRNRELDMTKGDYGFMKVPEGQYIMEIKTLGAMPLWLAGALNALRIYPASFSKYGRVYQDELLKDSVINRGGGRSAD